MSLLRIDNLTMRFGGLTAVKEVDLTVEMGQIIAVIGPNGAGKTTVFNVVTGIYKPTEGEILFDGKPLRRRMRPHLVVICVVIGFFTALLGFMFALDMNKLFQAAVKRPYGEAPEAFSYSVTWKAALAYYNGDLIVERETTRQSPCVSRVGQFPAPNWTLVWPTSRRRATRPRKTSTSAERSRNKSESTSLAGHLKIVAPEKSGDDWTVRDSTGLGSLNRTSRRIDVRREIEKINSLQDASTSRRQTAFLIGGVCFAVSSVGTFLVWLRSRRTADYIALAASPAPFRTSACSKT